MNVSRSAVLINSLNRGKLTLNNNLGSAFEYLVSVSISIVGASWLGASLAAAWNCTCCRMSLLPKQLEEMQSNKPARGTWIALQQMDRRHHFLSHGNSNGIVSNHDIYNVVGISRAIVYEYCMNVPTRVSPFASLHKTLSVITNLWRTNQHLS